jgi:hypothetical protein
MEPLWSQRSQPVATGGKWDGRKNGSNRRKPLPGGKEGVDGSSPSEGFAKFLLISSFCLPVRRLF